MRGPIVWILARRFPAAPRCVYPRSVYIAAEDTGATGIDRLRNERDFYRVLVELGEAREIEPFLERTLALVTQIAGARRGYLEVQEGGPGNDTAVFSLAHGCTDEDLAEAKAAISSGVIARALATGDTVATLSALADPRFKDQRSVQKHRIEAVLCAPIGDPAFGVVYLQDRAAGGAFDEDDRARVEILARHVAPLADRLLTRRRQRDAGDAMRPLRARVALGDVIGTSAPLAEVVEQLVFAAPLDISVLLTGPTGTGKTHLARLLHRESRRAARPFVELNCAALPEPLLESELFGALPGAHSTAAKKTIGKVEAAEGGTLFLDEIGDLGLGAQAKLLQLLQSKEYFPLGSSKPTRANIRVVAATNADLEALVKDKRFRADLYYRLHVLTIRVPALAERPGDISILAEHFIAHACRTHSFPALTLSAAARRALESAEWPGNVRQLANTIESAVVQATRQSVQKIERSHIFRERDPAKLDDDEANLTWQAATRKFQARLLLRVLTETGWNITETARRLDIGRSHVYALIRAFGLEEPRGE